jgi:hypothetical protein
LCHLGNISHLLGQATPPAALQEKIKGTPGLAEACGRMTEHLRSNLVDLQSTPLTLGQLLTLDAKHERFSGPSAAQANSLLTRNYRAPFVVPDLSRPA